MPLDAFPAGFVRPGSAGFMQINVSFGACGGRATRGPRQGNALHSAGCVSAPASPRVLWNLERAKPSKHQPSFCSQLGNRQGKRSDKFSNVSVMLCPTCWAHLHTGALSSLNLSQCDWQVSPMSIYSCDQWGGLGDWGSHVFPHVDLVLWAEPALPGVESRQ